MPKKTNEGDQQHQHELQEPGVLADEIEHREPLASAVGPDATKANLGSPSCLVCAVILSQALLADRRAVSGPVVGAEGLEPPTYALWAPLCQLS